MGKANLHAGDATLDELYEELMAPKRVFNCTRCKNPVMDNMDYWKDRAGLVWCDECAKTNPSRGAWE